jgi:hypothetical protein
LARVASVRRPLQRATTDVDQSITRLRLDDVTSEAELLRRQPEREADELGEVEHRHAELATDDAGGERLLQVEVQMAERARRDDAVGVGVDRVAEVAAGLLQRGGLVHRDDREATALVRARVVDHGAAERLDQLLEVGVARVLFVDPDAVVGADDVAAVERADLEVRQRALDQLAQLLSPMSSTSTQRKFLLTMPCS